MMQMNYGRGLSGSCYHIIGYRGNGSDQRMLTQGEEWTVSEVLQEMKVNSDCMDIVLYH